jgi:hypothetical protein
MSVHTNIPTRVQAELLLEPASWERSLSTFLATRSRTGRLSEQSLSRRPQRSRSHGAPVVGFRRGWLQELRSSELGRRSVL